MCDVDWFEFGIGVERWCVEVMVDVWFLKVVEGYVGIDYVVVVDLDCVCVDLWNEVECFG